MTTILRLMLAKGCADLIALSMSHRFSPRLQLAGFGLLSLLFPLHTMSGASGPNSPAPMKTTYQTMAREVEGTFRKEIVDVWYPRCIDTEHGGFSCYFDTQWKQGDKNPKTLVFQSRMTWVASQIVQRRPDMAPRFREIVRHGADFLCNQMWDSRDGGFFWKLTPQGKLPVDTTVRKHAYGMAFAIYALASAGKALDNKDYIQRAAETFLWLETHAHDKVHGGYYEALSLNGNPILSAPSSLPKGQQDYIGTPFGCKSMNTHLHLLESFAELYQVWPDPRLRVRLEELLDVVQNRIYRAPGIQNLYFTIDWKPIEGPIPYGHDVETAYLLLEASSVLGRPQDPIIWTKARALVDHSLRYGWDNQNGGFYDDGDAVTGIPVTTNKLWWAQAEGLNALLLMHEKYGSKTNLYWERFVQQWQFIQKSVIDHQYGGWFHTVNEDGSHVVVSTKDFDANGKGSRWKCAYHDGRALMNVTDRLRHLAEVNK